MKNQFFTIIALLTFSILVWSCGGEKTGEGQGEKLAEGSGDVAQVGNFMVLNLKLSTEDGEVLFDSEENNQPFLEPKLEAGSEFNSKVNELLQDFQQKGEVRRFTLTAEEAYEGSMPENLQADQKLIMEGKLIEILPNEDAIQSWQIREMERRQQAQYDIDFKLIDEYLAEKGIEAQTTESGLRYVINEKGNGKKAKAGDLVAVHYAGFLLDGSLFDTSIKSVAEANNAVSPGRDYAPLEFNVGAGMVIKGWDEGLMLVEEGGSATLYIPSPLAYGSQARGNVIPANAILIFDVELVEIK